MSYCYYEYTKHYPITFCHKVTSLPWKRFSPCSGLCRVCSPGKPKILQNHHISAHHIVDKNSHSACCFSWCIVDLENEALLWAACHSAVHILLTATCLLLLSVLMLTEKKIIVTNITRLCVELHKEIVEIKVTLRCLGTLSPDLFNYIKGISWETFISSTR